MPKFPPSYHVRSLALGLPDVVRLPAAERMPIARSFLRLKFKALGLSLLRSDRQATSEKILDWTVTSSDQPEDIDFLFHEMFVQRPYDMLDASKYGPGHQPTFFDCGANIGFATGFFKMKFPDARVVAFEPDPQTFANLKANVTNNGWANVELHQVGLGAEDTVGALEDTERSWNSQVQRVVEAGPDTAPERTIEVRRLSQFIGDSDVDLMKIDIEGAELGVLRELDEAGKLKQVQALAAEYHHYTDKPDSASRLTEFLGLLERNGFSVQIDTMERHLSPVGSPQGMLIRAFRPDAQPS